MNRLRIVLGLNGISCVAFGLLFVLAPASVAVFLAHQAPAPASVIFALGVGLIVNGLALFLAARPEVPSRAAVRFFSIGDFLWVAATLVLIVTGIWIETTAGVVAALAVGIFVGTAGTFQWQALGMPGMAKSAAGPGS